MADKKTYIILIASVFLILLGLLFVIFGSIEFERDVSNDELERLGVIIDAGGSGTRLIVYQYKGDTFKQLKFKECEKKGLTNYKDAEEMKALKNDLTNCFNDGVKLLPKGKKVPIYVAATAGMRLLRLRDEEAYNNTWSLVRQCVGESDFKPARSDTITGFEEAKWAWVAANYLKKTLKSGEKFGTIDFGSSSLQIAFEQNFNVSASEDEKVLNLDGGNISIYAHSYLCFGNNEIHRRFLAKLVKNANYAPVVTNPCFFNGFDKNFTSDYLWSVPCSSGNYARDVLGEDLNGAPNKTYLITGSGNFSQCFNLVSNLLKANCTQKDGLCGMMNIYQPQVHGHFLALSTYYHISKFLNLSSATGKTHFHNEAVASCRKPWEEIPKGSTPIKFVFPRCFQAAYSYYLLASGFKFDTDSWKVDYVKEIDGTKIGWSLGMIYSHKDDMYVHKYKVLSVVTEGGFIAMLVIGIICLIVGFVLGLGAYMTKKKTVITA